MSLARRAFLARGAAIAAAPFFNPGRFRLFAASPVEYSAATLELMRGSLIVDMLGLLTLDYRKLIDWQVKAGAFGAADLDRIRASGINVFHPAVGFTQGDTYSACLGDIKRWNQFIAAHPESFLRVDVPGDLVRSKLEGKVGIVLGFQNSNHFRSEGDVEYFFSMGQRISQISYNGNLLGGGSSDAIDAGLTEFGAKIVAKMNALGMAADVSHCGDRTTLDVIAASKKPVLVTHSNCRALALSKRCKTDDAIRKLGANGGVMGITMVRPFVGGEKRAGMEAVLDHVDHVARLTGVEHVAIGTDVDLDGRDHGGAHQFDLDGETYVRKIFDFTEALVRRRYSRQDIALILGGNFQRAMTQIAELRPPSAASSESPRPVAPGR